MKHLWYRFLLWKNGWCYKHKCEKDHYDGWRWCSLCEREKRQRTWLKRDQQVLAARKGLDIL